MFSMTFKKNLLLSKIKCKIRMNSAAVNSITGQPTQQKTVSCQCSEACSYWYSVTASSLLKNSLQKKKFSFSASIKIQNGC